MCSLEFDCPSTRSHRPRPTVQLSAARRAWLVILNRPDVAVIAIVPTLVMLATVFYFLTLGVLISRVYSRWAGIESFLFPVGFAFTVLGQSIKLVLVLV
jgi:hypothetical protein